MKKLFFSDKVMLGVVLLNVAAIFLQECGLDIGFLSVVDIFCSVAFLAEMVLKQKAYGFKPYWKDGWNALDGTITIITLPALVSYFVPGIADYGFVVAFRALRVFKLFRTARKFPNLKGIWGGFKLALRQSAAFLLAYFVIIVIVAMFNSALFSQNAPEYFATPLEGIYSMFQMFTVEGWYEIPNSVVGGMSPVLVHVVRLYFCLLLIGGGIIGMSLINSIFVDALAADNNDDVKAKLEQLEAKIDKLQRTLDEKDTLR